MKESFKKKDIKRYQKEHDNLVNNKIYEEDWQEYLTITRTDDIKDITIPLQMFVDIIINKRPEYVKHLKGLKINFSEIGETKDNYWLEDTDYIGLTFENKIDIRLRKDGEHSIVSLLWILLHEFRHMIQNKNTNIESCNWNTNYTNFIEYLMKLTGKEQNVIDHVLHEIVPYEVDANIFACELLEIDYPSSKFGITKKTLGMLK